MRTPRRLATPRLPGAGTGPVQSPVHAPGRRRTGGVGQADRATGRLTPPVRIPADLGPVEGRGLVGQQGDGPSPLASAGPEAGRATGQPQAPPASRPRRQRLPSPAV